MANLDELYRDIIMDHYRTPRNRGELAPPAIKAEGFNPLCGDEITVYIEVQGGVITDIKLTGQGCSISQSSSSLMSAAVKGRSVEEARATIAQFKDLMMGVDSPDPSDTAALRRLGEIAALSGVTKFPVRIKCATLAWNTLTQALDDATS